MFADFALKEYQSDALMVLENYLAILGEEQTNYLETKRKLKKLNLDAEAKVGDWTEKAFRGVCPAVKFSARKDCFGEPIPAVCYKVPTGGGKTLLATLSLIKIFHNYINRQNGLVLWLVPNDAIYRQTLKALKDNEHPYRKFLNPAFRGRVKVLQKKDRITRQMVDQDLCILLLMLQSSNRKTRDYLNAFKARGDYQGFFPLESDSDKNKEIKELVPNLDIYGGNMMPIIKNSLANMLRIIRPIVVLDEQHKATSELATDTLLTFNPRFILELSATPKDYKLADGSSQAPNRLVDVSGSQLLREEMIKIPIEAKVVGDEKWQDVLRLAKDKLDELAAKAEDHLAETNLHIRPIMLVQVERTGEEQNDGRFVHAENAKEHLLQLGLQEQEIKIKSASNDEIENIDLLAKECSVRAIITKSALQEGWDCPFAYVLVSLSSSKSITAITQLLGRVLRQPYTKKSKLEDLNKSYVFCLHKETNVLIEKIKKSLEDEGLGDVARQINVVGGDKKVAQYITIKRRDKFKDTKIVLPRVVWTGDKQPRELYYLADVLQYIDWLAINVEDIASDITPYSSSREDHLITFDTSRKDLLQRDVIESRVVAEKLEKNFATSDVVRAIIDIVPNAWVAFELAKRLENALVANGWSKDIINDQYFNIVKQFRKKLREESDQQAEKIFKENLKNGKITFNLRSDDLFSWVTPKTIVSIKNSPLLQRSDAGHMQKSLFAPALDDGYNEAEKGVAVMLDEHKMVDWWFRNHAQDRYYNLQGWRSNRVYPDFIFFLNSKKNEICVWEGKGDHLEDNQDSKYKEKLMKSLSSVFTFEKLSSVGRLDVENKDGKIVSCKMVLYSEFEETLNRQAGDY